MFLSIIDEGIFHVSNNPTGTSDFIVLACLEMGSDERRQRGKFLAFQSTVR